MQSTSVASRCPTLHELLAANLEYKIHARSPAHQLAVPCTLSAHKVCTLVLFISLALFQLDQVLSSPGEHVDEPAANTPRLGLSYNTGEASLMDSSSLLKNLHLPPTPAHNTTLMFPRQVRPYSDTLLEDTVLGEDATVLQDPTRRGWCSLPSWELLTARILQSVQT
jgi:hypothetical protein